MTFSETILPPGKILYKGLENMSCKIILRDTRLFYLTESARTAGSYGNLCHFKAKKTLRLFDLTHSNIEKVMPYVSKDTGSLLRTIIGTGVTIGEQVAAVKLLLGNKGAGKLPRTSDTRRGQRLSYKDVNRVVFGNLAREFLMDITLLVNIRYFMMVYFILKLCWSMLTEVSKRQTRTRSSLDTRSSGHCRDCL